MKRKEIAKYEIEEEQKDAGKGKNKWREKRCYRKQKR